MVSHRKELCVPELDNGRLHLTSLNLTQQSDILHQVMTLCLAMVSSDELTRGQIWVGADTLGTWDAGGWSSKDDNQQKVYPLGKRYLLLEAGQETRTIKAWIRELSVIDFDKLSIDEATRQVMAVIESRYKTDFKDRYVAFTLAICGHDSNGPGIYEIRSIGPGSLFLGNATDACRIAIGVQGPADHYFYCFWRKGLKWEALDRLGKFIFAACGCSQWGVGGALETWKIPPNMSPQGPNYMSFEDLLKEMRPILQGVRDAVIGDGEPSRF